MTQQVSLQFFDWSKINIIEYFKNLMISRKMTSLSRISNSVVLNFNDKKKNYQKIVITCGSILRGNLDFIQNKNTIKIFNLG